MTPTASRAAVDRRLARLTEQWGLIMEARGVRIGRWLIASDEWDFFASFLELQARGDLTSPDVLVHCPESFVDPERHGFELVAALRRESEGLEVREPVDGVSDVQALADACNCFVDEYLRGFEGLAVFLDPETVARAEAWQHWLQRLLGAEVRPALRFMVVDSKEQPRLDGLQRGWPDLVLTVEPDLDMGAALQEMSDAEGGDSPGDHFRSAFVALSVALGKQDWTAAESAADRAITIASDNAWPKLEATVHMAMGAGAMGLRSATDAAERYERAIVAASHAVEQDEEGAGEVLLQARMGEGAAFFQGGDDEGAASAYEQAAVLALEHDNPLLAMESWRMATHAHHRKGDFEDGWRCGESSLEAAASLEEPMRRQSTLPDAGRLLLQLATRDPVRTALVHERMAALLGDDWEHQDP